MSNYKVNPFICMGLVRFVGGVFFLVFGHYAYVYLSGYYNLNLQLVGDASQLGWRGYVVIVGSFFVALIALVVGQGIGSTIKIYSDNVSTNLTVYWHFFANANIAWIIVSCISLTIFFSKEVLTGYFRTTGNYFFYHVAVIASVGGILTCFTLHMSAKIIKRGNELGILVNRTGPFIIWATIGYFQFSYFGMPEFFGIIAGLIIPLVYVSNSYRMWRKDEVMRHGEYFNSHPY